MRSRFRRWLWPFALLAACAEPPPPAVRPPRVALDPVVLMPVDVMVNVGGVDVLQGGFGSALSVPSGKSGPFYFLTDRGPNVDLLVDDHKLFPVPGYAPSIGEYRWQDDGLVRARRIALHWPDGQAISGLPAPHPRSSVEVAFASGGRRIPRDPSGVDPEGLVAMPDGSFWVSDEYGPWLLHVANDGAVIEHIGPFAGGARKLPSVLSARRPNRGIEALARVPGTRTLAALLQSPLDNPKAAGRASRATRMLFFDLDTAASRQLVYLLDAPDNRITEMAAVSETRFLVIEIDGNIPGDPKEPSGFLRIFEIDTAGATDVSDPLDGPDGLRFGGRTLEELRAEDLAGAGITPVRKKLLLDLLDPAIAYPYDKPEGLAILGPRLLGVVNDDDFGIEADGRGGIAPKRTKGGRIMRNELWLLRLREPLDGAR